MFSIPPVVTLDWFSLKKQIVQSMGRRIDLTQDLLHFPSELLSNLGPPG